MLYELKDLPHPPQSMIDKINLGYRPDINTFSTDSKERVAINSVDDWKHQPYQWIKPMAVNNNVRYRFDEEDEQWIKDNIVSEFDEDNSGVMFFDTEQPPHTDTTRTYVLLYNVHTGGPDASLGYFIEKGQPLHRPLGLAITDYSILDELVRLVDGPKQTWYLVDTCVLHGVRNLSSTRVNLQVSFNQLPEGLLK